MPIDHPENNRHTERDISQGTVQKVFVGALLLVVLSVTAEYLLGDFRGLNPGADFGLVISVTLIIALLVGLLAAVFHR